MTERTLADVDAFQRLPQVPDQQLTNQGDSALSASSL
jgi:hypothetical protein